MQLALLVLACLKPGRFGALLISAAAVTLVSAISIAALSFFEHSRAPRPSILLNAYLFVTILFDIAQTRTLWLASISPDEVLFSKLSTAALALKGVLILLESQQKSKSVQWDDVKEHSPEETSGLFGLGALLWLNRLFLTGYRKVLTLSDLFPLDRSLATEDLHLKLASHLEAANASHRKHALAVALAKTLAVPFLLPVGPRIALTGFEFCQPFLQLRFV